MSDHSSAAGANKLRVLLLGIFLAAGMAVYFIQLFYLQVVKGKAYLNRVDSNTTQAQPIPTQRGEIYDRNANKPLVINVDSHVIYVIPADIPANKKTDVVSALAKLLKVDENDIWLKIRKYATQAYSEIEIKDGVDYNLIIYLSEHKEDFPGVGWKYKPKRQYVQGGSITHVIGYVGEITMEEWRLLSNKGYTAQTILGKSGIEKQYDEILRGKEGKHYAQFDAKGKKIPGSPARDVPPILGNNLILSIDMKMQQLAEQALGERMGSIVIMKPATGEILAMSSYPYFDPNLLYADERAKYFAQYYSDKRSPFLNRAVQSTYPPASTFKIVMSAAIYQDKLFPTDKKINCDGVLYYGGREFHCWEKSGHGWLNLQEGFANSCDVFYFTVGRDYVGIDNISKYGKEFGLGSPTMIDLPQEAAGFMPTQDWKYKTTGERWQNGDTMNASIGQGWMTASPIQLANIVCMVTNEGTVYKPHVVKEIRDAVTGEVVRTIKPEILKTSFISRDTFQNLKKDMLAVLDFGTARYVINTKAVKIAAKTGTGEVGFTDKWQSWFASYAPADAPVEDQIVVVVSVEASNDWEWWAPKAANIIYQAIYGNQTFEQAIDTLGVQFEFIKTKSEAPR